MELRDYQKEAVDEALAQIAFGSTKIIIEAPVSYGKTAVIADICKELSQDIIVSVSISDLIDQLAETFDAMEVEYSIIKSGRSNEFDTSKRVHIAMEQTLYSWLKNKPDDFTLSPYLMIRDEGHIANSTKRTEFLFQHLKPQVELITTATPYTGTGFKLTGYEVITTKNMKDLTDDGYLSPLKYFIPKWAEKIDYSKIKMNAGEYNISELNEIIGSDSYIKNMIEAMDKMDAKNKKTIVFTTNTEMAEEIASKLKEHGYYAESYHSKQKQQDVKNLMNAFRNNTMFQGFSHELNNRDIFTANTDYTRPVKCIVSVSKLLIGFSVNDIQLGILARKFGRHNTYVQAVGRLARKHPDKEYGEILDLGQNVSTHGFADDPYDPPEYTNDSKINKKALEEARKYKLDHLSIVVNETPTEINRQIYVKKIQEIKRNEQKLTNLKINQLFAKLEISNDPVEMIAIATVLFDKMYSDDCIDDYGKPCRGYTTSTGKLVKNFLNPGSISWIAELWIQAFEKEEEYYKKKYTKSLKTRIKNLLKTKGNIYALRFFIEYLLEQDEFEKIDKNESTDEQSTVSNVEIIIENENKVHF